MVGLRLAAAAVMLGAAGVLVSKMRGKSDGDPFEAPRDPKGPLFTDREIMAQVKPSPFGRYGPKWKNTKPGGWPAAMVASDRGEAAPFIRAEAARYGFDPEFTKFCLELAWNESRQAINLPGNPFEMRCGPEDPGPRRVCVGRRGDRPAGTRLNGAGGLYQWNSGALRHYLEHNAPEDQKYFQNGVRAFAHEMGPAVQVWLPIKRYSMLWRAARGAGADPITANWWMRYWHRRPTAAWRLLRERRWTDLTQPKGYKGPPPPWAAVA